LSKKRIYLSPPVLDENDKLALIRAFDSGWIAPLGPEVDLFEQNMNQYLGVNHAIALSSGTAGLHLALLAVGIQPGDKVIVPTLTFAATAFAVNYVGAEPIFIDSDELTWTIDTELLEEYLKTTKSIPKAIISVDVFGRPCNFAELNRIASEFGIILISDSAESLGSKFNAQPVGGQALVSVFSFNGNKILSTSGGGMLVTNDSAIASKVRYLSTQAREDVHWYEHKEVGFNYRLSNLLASIGNSQLARIDESVQLRKNIVNRYSKNFRETNGLNIIGSPRWGSSNFWLTNLVIDPKIYPGGKELVKKLLDSNNIESRFSWKPLHMQPIYRDSESILNGNAERVFSTSLCLPTGTNLLDSEIDLISNLTMEALRNAYI
jgi:dTDP-4-amino-4,6-dideoxygalactose transaminase